MGLPEKRYASACRALKEVFGYDAPREFQARVLKATFEGRDVFAVAPTGGGKSMVYTLPALVLPGVVIVVSPLLALMKDQQEALAKRNIRAARITSDAPGSQVAAALRDPTAFEIIFVSPEKLATKEFLNAFRGVPVSLIALDEAHVLAKWGKDFRPAYGRMKAFLDAHDEALRIACTATADEEVDLQVNRLFTLRNPVRVIGSPWRDNIRWVIKRNAVEDDLIDLVRGYQQETGSQVIYCSSRKATEHIATELKNHLVDATHYHAGMDPSLRQTTQERFMKGNVRCVVATSAFGMGVDKPDIRLVAYWQTPSSLFDLVQGVGRGSRDGKPAVGWVNVGSAAERTQTFLLKMSNPGIKVYQRLWSQFAKHHEPMRWGRSTLVRCGGIGPEAFEGQLDSALSFLEFNGGISTSPAGTIYRLPLKDAGKARAIAKHYGARIDGGVMVYEVGLDEQDRINALVNTGAVTYTAPDDLIVVRRLTNECPVTEEMVDTKMQRAEDALEAIREFCWASDKKAFVEAYFSRAEGACT